MGGAPSANQKNFLNEALTLYDMQVAARLHDFWRAPRKLPDGTYEPRVKTINGRNFDIANMTFRQLPAKLQYENLISTKILCSAVVKQMEKGLPCTPEFVTSTAVMLHKAYMSRNVGDADRGWKDLEAEEQDKTRTFVHLAIEIYNDMHSGLPPSRGTSLSEEGGRERLLGMRTRATAPPAANGATTTGDRHARGTAAAAGAGSRSGPDSGSVGRRGCGGTAGDGENKRSAGGGRPPALQAW